MVVRPGTDARVREIFERWDLSAAVVGRITDTRRVVVKEADATVAELPVELLVDEAPSYDRPQAAPADLEARWQLPELPLAPPSQTLVELLERPTITSKRWVYDQYDWSVRNSTVAGPGAADAAVVRLPGPDLDPSATTRRGLALTLDMNSRYVELDPRRGAKLGVLEAVRNLACVGARSLGLTDCLNFGNPEKPRVMWSFVEAVEGMAEACRELDTPVVSGNVSLYNETEGRPILPTPTVGVVGTVEDVSRVPGLAFRRAGDDIYLLGDLKAMSLAGSERLLLGTGRLAGRPPEPDFDRARAVHAACIEAVSEGWLASAHDVAEGGLAVALAECCVGRFGEAPIGAEIDLDLEEDVERSLFGEGPSVIVVSAAPEHAEGLRSVAERHRAPLTRIGRVGGDRLVWSRHLDVPARALYEAFHHGLERALGVHGDTSGEDIR